MTDAAAAAVTVPEAPRAGLWPTEDQTLLLQAALAAPKDAEQAFLAWVKRQDLEKEFDQGTFRLLPLLYDNLHRAGVQHPLMGRLKGIYRLAWYKNNRLFEQMRPIVATLHEAGIPIMTLKGVPLILQYYKNHALRPMADIDVLVPANYARQAIDVMEGAGFQHYAPPSSDYLKYRHAMQYISKAGAEIDLHWHALYEFCEDGADKIFWDTARNVDFNGTPTLAPDPTRMFFHTVVHGVRWNDEPPIRWIPDAMTILRTAGHEIDWNEIVALAAERQVAHRLRLGLHFLHRHFGADIPESTLRNLDRQGTSWIQHIENTCVLRDRMELHRSPMGSLWLIFAEYCRYARNEGPIKFAVGFTHYVRFRWGLRGRSEIPGVIVRGLMKRVAGLKPGSKQTPAGVES